MMDLLNEVATKMPIHIHYVRGCWLDINTVADYLHRKDDQLSRIKNLFKVQSKKVIPYITAGYPSKDLTVDLVLAAEKSGAAMIELGMPFSDPLADGPIIQESSQVAIKNNVDIGWILDTVSLIRLQSEIPLVLMGYINPIIKYGMNNFICDCSKVGVDGLIDADITVQTCWDSDRLDLGRVGIKPSSDRLCTEVAKRSVVIEEAYKRSLYY